MLEIKEVIIKKTDLKKLRERKGLSLRQLEKLSGVGFAQISNYERGLVMSEPTWDKIKKFL